MNRLFIKRICQYRIYAIHKIIYFFKLFLLFKMYFNFFLIIPLAFVSAFQKLDSGLLPFWYPIMTGKQFQQKKIHNITVMNHPMVLYNNHINHSMILHTDICPHQGASLSKGWVNEFGNIQCPYHGFEFCNGMFCKIPNPSLSPPTFKSRIKLPVYPVRQYNDTLFFFPISNHLMNDSSPFFPPEEYDPSFRSVSGSIVVHKNWLVICENLLDMLHISYVHSFGSRVNPLPYSVRTLFKNNVSGITEFYYQPRDLTISNQIGRVTTVIVQNEYHLPTNTITRVFAGNVVKTVFTRSLPLSKDRTILFWRVYRNFWIDPYLPIFSIIGDVILRFLMEKTIQEDVSILKYVYPEYRQGPLKTKYDTTIHNFRNAVQHYLNQSDTL